MPIALCFFIFYSANNFGLVEEGVLRNSTTFVPTSQTPSLHIYNLESAPFGGFIESLN
jgi:hypothetical protein